MERIMYRKTLDVHKNGVQFMLQGFETADNMSRVIEISLMASGDAIDFPLERMVAMMYVTTQSAKEPSINECTIKDNKVVYNVHPIVEEGITTMQLKLIETGPDGATSVLASPKFSVEVTKSGVDDEGAEQTTTFTALENAIAKATVAYNSRLLRIEIDETCIFRGYYADGIVYESDEIRKLLMQQSTDLNLEALIKEGIANFTADEVATVLDDKYKNLLAKAKYITDFMADFTEATFVQWDAETENTPYKAGLTECTAGFALVFGAISNNHTIVAWTMGGKKTETFTHCISGGADKGWKSSTGPLNFGNGKGTVYADDDSTYLEATKDTENYRRVLVKNPSIDGDALVNAIKLLESIGGESKGYNIFGEHNREAMGIPKVLTGSYEGVYTQDVSGFETKVLSFDSCPDMLFISANTSTATNTSGVTFMWVNPDTHGKLGNVNPIASWDEDAKTFTITASSPEQAMNSAGITYYWYALYF